MIGRQSHNVGLRAVPAPGPVKIDGDLSDWDFSGRVWSFADLAIRDRYSAETAAMWDRDFLYLAVKFADPSPLHNTTNPKFDPRNGWMGDAVQLRLLTDWPQWITFWYFSNERRAAMLQDYWPTPTDAGEKRMITTLRVGEPDSIELGDGVQLAFKLLPDGGGYVQEARIPWKLLYKSVPDIAAGLTFSMGLEFFWGSATGETLWPAHRYADNLAVGATSREFFWKTPKIWGEVKLLPTGKVEVLNYRPPENKLAGAIPIRAEIPESAKEFTVVIENADGRRVRNLGAQLNAELYSIAVKDSQRTVEVKWDGLDDAGKPVAPGEYGVRGLSQFGLGADYVMSFFNPGTPPWDTRGSGGWGADHTVPSRVAAVGDWGIIGWSTVEGGHGVIGVGPDGLKKWGEKRGTNAIATDSESVYFLSDGKLCRLNLTDGIYKPFVLEGQPRPFELSMAEILGATEAVAGKPVSLAISKKSLAVAFDDGQIALLDPASAARQKTLAIPAPTAVAFSNDGKLYALTDGRLAEVNLENGNLRVIPTPGLMIPPASGTLTVDPDGNLGIFDPGPDQQIKFFTPEGKPAYAVGKKGGRPVRGAFDEQAMREVSSIAADGQGRVWASEAWDYPRRVSVFGKDGKLVRDYVGNTGYAGSGTYLHDQDPTLAYYGPVEMKLDPVKRTWKVSRVLWVPEAGENFPIIPGYEHSFTVPQRFRAKINGKDREYLFAPSQGVGRPYVVYQETAKGWQPVAALGLLGELSGKILRKGQVLEQPSGDFAGKNAADGFFWNDGNGDGRVQLDEVTIVPAPVPAVVGKPLDRNQRALPLGSGWGPRMSTRDLSFVAGGAHYVPLRYTKEGAPVFGPDSIQKSFGGTEYVPVPDEEGWLTAVSDPIRRVNEKTGETEWTYPNPYPGVHGSHRAPMPQPGLVIGPLKIMGTAKLPGNQGSVFAIRGNLGQDFYFTSDGLLIGTMFQDGRLPSPSLPDKESELVGSPMEAYGGGGEPFSGWFGGQSDGKIRLTSGMGRQTSMILEVKGLDRIERFTAPPVNVTDALLAEAAKERDARAAVEPTAIERRVTIARVAQPPAHNGKEAGWSAVPVFPIASKSSSFKGEARLAYDDANLYLAVDVEDPSPWKNSGVDFTRLFKTGDAVDLQLATRGGDANRKDPATGDLRLVFANLKDRPTTVLMQPINPSAPANAAKTYRSPVGDKSFAEVRELPDVKLAVRNTKTGYRLEAVIPLTALGLKPKPGESLRGDVGFISSDADGKINTARTYWANPSTNLVNDEPLEAWLNPGAWGEFVWGK